VSIRFWHASIAGIALIFLQSGAVRAQEIEYPHAYGDSITGAFEGWYQNPDGSATFLVGYYNRNLKEELDIPIGPNNHIDPGGPDQGQPTHFYPARQWGLFTIRVPKDFGDKKLTWTIVANGKSTTIPLVENPDWLIQPMIDALNNTPPVLSFQPFSEGGPTTQGPNGLVISKTAKVGQPPTLTAYGADDGVSSPGRAPEKGPPFSVRWTLYRGPAAVKFAEARPKVEKTEDKMPTKAIFTGKTTTTATFSVPGDYVLHLIVNDVSGDGGGGFQCCWTSGKVNVTVTP